MSGHLVMVGTVIAIIALALIFFDTATIVKKPSQDPHISNKPRKSAAEFASKAKKEDSIIDARKLIKC